MRGDSHEVRRLCLHKTHYFVLRHILSTDKMADYFFNFGRKWQSKNLHMSEKSSTFVA